MKEGLSKKELGIRYNCDPCVIDRVLKNLGIKIRNNSESKDSKDNLHVHHLIPFKSILDRIIIQNYPLSPVDDADKLNNPNNLITVCSMCHHKIHGQL